MGSKASINPPVHAQSAGDQNTVVFWSGPLGSVLMASPEDAAEAQRLVQAFVEGKDGKANVVSRLKMATPLQVNLRVRIAEVSRNFARNIGVNLLTVDGTGYEMEEGSYAYLPAGTRWTLLAEGQTPARFHWLTAGRANSSTIIVPSYQPPTRPPRTSLPS